MELQDSTLWWIVTGLLLALELATGTFYLLMFALGTAAAALGAHAGAGVALQLTLAALLGVAAVLLWHRRRPLARANQTTDADREAADLSLDIGEEIEIEAAQWTAHGQAQVRYRGAMWTAVLRSGAASASALASAQTPSPAGRYKVVQLLGNRLVVEPVMQADSAGATQPGAV